MTLADLGPTDRDWIASRSVEVLHTLLHVQDVEVRENYIALMLYGAYIQGQKASADAMARSMANKWPPKPHVVGA